jgi:hypothetical protein
MRLLTFLLALLFTANFQLSLLSCGGPDGAVSCAAAGTDCCAGPGCCCCLKTAHAGKPCSSLPVTVPARQNAPLQSVTAQAAVNLLPPVSVAVAAPPARMAATLDPPSLFAQTHAFLI